MALASHEPSGLHVWSQQPGLEVASSQKRGFSDKQAVAYAHHPDDREDERAAAAANASQGRSRNPFGLSPAMFGLVVALLTAIVVGGAVGGGFGSQIKCTDAGSTSASTTTVFVTQPATASAASPTPTSSTYTAYAVALPAQVLSVPLDCPNLNSRTITTAESDTYIFECGVDYVGNDLAALIAYRLEDCCTACSAFNYQQRNSGLDQKCQAFTFNANMSYTYANEVPPGGNNCWLKSISDQGTAFTDSGHLIVGGKLAT